MRGLKRSSIAIIEMGGYRSGLVNRLRLTDRGRAENREFNQHECNKREQH